jgi:hypothetical protein
VPPCPAGGQPAPALQSTPTPLNNAPSASSSEPWAEPLGPRAFQKERYRSSFADRRGKNTCSFDGWPSDSACRISSPFRPRKDRATSQRGGGLFRLPRHLHNLAQSNRRLRWAVVADPLRLLTSHGVWPSSKPPCPAADMAGRLPLALRRISN